MKYPAVKDAVGVRVRTDHRQKTAIAEGRVGDQLVNFGKFAQFTLEQLLRSKESQSYVSYLLRPTTKPTSGSRMEEVITWLKSQKGRVQNCLCIWDLVYNCLLK